MPNAFFAGTLVAFAGCHFLEQNSRFLSTNRLERIVTARDACFSTLGAALNFYVAYRYDTLNLSIKLLMLAGAAIAGYCAYKFSKNSRSATTQTRRPNN